MFVEYLLIRTVVYGTKLMKSIIELFSSYIGAEGDATKGIFVFVLLSSDSMRKMIAPAAEMVTKCVHPGRTISTWPVAVVVAAVERIFVIFAETYNRLRLAFDALCLVPS